MKEAVMKEESNKAQAIHLLSVFRHFPFELIDLLLETMLDGFATFERTLYSVGFDMDVIHPQDRLSPIPLIVQARDGAMSPIACEWYSLNDKGLTPCLFWHCLFTNI